MDAVRIVMSVSVGLPEWPVAGPVRRWYFDENRRPNAWYPSRNSRFLMLEAPLVSLSHPLVTSQVEAELSISAPHLGAHPKVPPWVPCLWASCHGGLPLMVSPLGDGLMRVPPSRYHPAPSLPTTDETWWRQVLTSASSRRLTVEGQGMCVVQRDKRWVNSLSWSWKAPWSRGQ